MHTVVEPRRARRAVGAVVAIVAIAGLTVGCAPQPSWCNAELTHNNGRTWCAAGRQPIIGASGGATQEVLIAAFAVPPVPTADWAALDLLVSVSVNTHGNTVFQLHLDQASVDIATGFGVGTFETGVAAGATTTMTLFADGVPLTVSRGSLTITRWVLRGANPEGLPEGEALHLTATYEADTDQGHVTGSARVA